MSDLMDIHTASQNPLLTLDSRAGHLRELLEGENGSGAAGRFYKSLVRLDKDPKWNSAALDGQKHGAVGGSRRGFSLRPYFQCLECPIACSRAGRREHQKRTGHTFCKIYAGYATVWSDANVSSMSSPRVAQSSHLLPELR